MLDAHNFSALQAAVEQLTGQPESYLKKRGAVINKFEHMGNSRSF